jgi:DNA polymerase III alpha subunit
MIPIFKSHYSIGKSILTLKNPEKVEEDGADSVFSIAQEYKLKQVCLVEDSLVGFLEAKKTSEELGINLYFGLRMEIENGSSYKVIIFAKNSEGIKDLNSIYSDKFCSEEKFSIDSLKSLWTDNLLLVIPFYDSFIFNNTLSFAGCMPDFNFTNPSFLLEDNGLPFDHIIRKKVLDYCNTNQLETLEAKSIYYKNKSDFDAWLTYKIATNRRFGKNQSLYCPNFDHLGSDEFCFESYLNKNDRQTS